MQLACGANRNKVYLVFFLLIACNLLIKSVYILGTFTMHFLV